MAQGLSLQKVAPSTAARRVARRIGGLVVAVVMSSGWAAADVRPHSLFADHMVLPRGASTPVWGTATAGERVVVTFAGQTRETRADADGVWRVELRDLEAGGPHTLTISGTSIVTLSDILVGDVWLCAGQSNMEWALARCTGGAEAVAGSADHRLVRLCTIPHARADKPQQEVAARWSLPDPQGTRFFSGVAWWFATKLQHEIDVPVGVINCSYGGTTIQAWMPADVLARGPWPQDASTDVTIARADHESRRAKLQPAMDRYLIEKAAAQREGRPAPEQPVGWPGDFRGPTTLWNGMVAPLRSFPIRGVAWYQGESNAYARVADTYGDLLPAMIRAWREGFGQPDLPFLVFQISRYRARAADPNTPSGMAQLREAQDRTVRTTPRTALVVTLDLGIEDVHYPEKEPAAERGVKAALALAYGRGIAASGPRVRDVECGPGRAVARFDHVSGRLVTRDGPLRGFTIAGGDRRFVVAEASIEGETVVVTSPDVAEPAAIRYGWADMPDVNLFDEAGLPAAPFRSDVWPLAPPVSIPQRHPAVQ